MFLAAPFGPRTPEPALLALSSVASALAVGVTYRTARLFTRELPALLACTFLALCPTVWGSASASGMPRSTIGRHAPTICPLTASWPWCAATRRAAW
jgi:hypothetical protein